MHPLLDGGYSATDLHLQCPNCTSNYSHQHRVEVFNRVEDAEIGLHAVVDADSVSINQLMVGNPSGRRDGITIHIDCEECGITFLLNVYQHKGYTLLSTAIEGE